MLLAVTAAMQIRAQNLVTNGDFESPQYSSPPYYRYLANPSWQPQLGSLPGWTVLDDGVGEPPYLAALPAYTNVVHHGSYGIALNQGSGIRTTVTIQSNTVYQLSYWIKLQGSVTPSPLEVTVAGAVTDVPVTTNWTRHVSQFTAASTELAAVVQFNNVSPAGPGQTIGLDEISLVEHPPGFSTAFTYQVRLTEGGGPANSVYDLTFALFDAPSSGNQVGVTLTNFAVATSSGLVTLPLDFGASAFGNGDRWLQIGVRTNGGGGDFALFNPRQPLTPTPYAIVAASANALNGTLPDSQLSANIARLGSNQTFSGTLSFDPPSGPPFVVGNSNKVINLNADLLDGLDSSAFWRLGGNGGTSPVTNFIGTTDNQALELKVNNVTAIRIEPRAGSPNVIAGYVGPNGNRTTLPAVQGATIGGGGYNGSINTAGDFATVGGGYLCLAEGTRSTIGGGAFHRANAEGSVIGGGVSNTVSGEFTFIGGGAQNLASVREATIGGGVRNSANGEGATIGGGKGNTAIFRSSTVSGGESNEARFSASVGGGQQNRAIGNSSTVAGGAANSAETLVSAIGGGWHNHVLTGGDFGTIGGGLSNRVTAQYAGILAGDRNTAAGNYAAISGGELNVVGFNHGTIAGGAGNSVQGGWAAIGGGLANVASGPYSFVGGGAGNSARGSYSTVGGGQANTATNSFTTVGGGTNNTASGLSATVGGGNGNTASGGVAAVVGGQYNVAMGTYTFVGGGLSNTASNYSSTVCGGSNNVAGANNAAVGGGDRNVATGRWSIIPGGVLNEANQDKTFAAGTRAKAWHYGAFVWADGTSTWEFPSLTANEFAARATGGVRFVSAIDGSGNPSAGVQLPAGGGAWSALSDRNAKGNFQPADGRAVLEKLAAMPVQTWNYRSQDAAIRHIGPTAQDFAAAFGVGEDERHISTVDADGVALAAIQGLHQVVKEKDAEIEALRQDVAELKAAVNTLAEKSRAATR